MSGWYGDLPGIDNNAPRQPAYRRRKVAAKPKPKGREPGRPVNKKRVEFLKLYGITHKVLQRMGGMEAVERMQPEALALLIGISKRLKQKLEAKKSAPTE